MAIEDTIRLYSIPYTKPSGDARFLGLALAEIEKELKQLSNSLSTPIITLPEIDLSGIQAAISELKSGFPGPVPPQNLDLNPVYRSYEDTANAIKQLLGEVKTTNQRIAHIGGTGASGPSVIGINDQNGYRLKINPDGSINTTTGGSSDDPTLFETRLDYDTRTDANPIYVGKAPQGTAIATNNWTIQKFEYDSSARLIRVQIMDGAWASRATLPWT